MLLFFHNEGYLDILPKEKSGGKFKFLFGNIFEVSVND